MARKPNPETYTIRQYITNWLTRTNVLTFTVPLLMRELESLLEPYKGCDLSKQISNDLIRREQCGMLVSEVGEPHGVGRPPRVYKQRWRMH